MSKLEFSSESTAFHKSLNNQRETLGEFAGSLTQEYGKNRPMVAVGDGIEKEQLIDCSRPPENKSDTTNRLSQSNFGEHKQSGKGDGGSKDLATLSEVTFTDPFEQKAHATLEKESTGEKSANRASTKGSGDYDPFSSDALKSAGLSQTAIDKMTGTAEHRDAEEFHKKFGSNPNSPEAIAWIEQKIQQQATKEAKEAEEKAERSGLAPVGDAGYFYAQALLLHIAARHPNFNANNVHGSYFSHESGWKGMQGFFETR